MKEFETITEYQLLRLAYGALLERITREEEINERTKKTLVEIIAYVNTD